MFRLQGLEEDKFCCREDVSKVPHRTRQLYEDEPLAARDVWKSE